MCFKASKRTRKICEGRGRLSCPALMGPACLRPFIILLGLFLLFLSSTSAVKVENFTLFEEKLKLEAHTANMIPCVFHTRRRLNPLRVQLEWGKMDKEGYVSLIHLDGNHVRKAAADFGDKYQLFIPQVSQGNCSLVINPTDIADSGTYQVRLRILGKLYEPVPSIEIQVVDQRKVESRAWGKKKTTVPPTTIATVPPGFVDDVQKRLAKIDKMAIIVIVLNGVFVGIAILLGVLVFITYRKKSSSGDEENPPKKGKQKGKKEPSDESEESSSSESEESSSES
ncbi:uncharacterized protein LOC101730590 [Xenopus tropicalis]|uniref:Uncharacterized protein LOC101730590 n=1 Tax=Xenopus tropicalis TaxID=8364 RepID=A0A8J1IQ20_XENTR|nr:uncharacterized protein LOC101730590 [Xenopus tropicalis]